MPDKLIILLLFLLLSFTVQAQQKINDSTSIFYPEIIYVGDMVGNFHGGMQTGTAYLGMLSLKLTVNLWKGGSILLNAANTHGAEPSAELLGDYQIASNIEAGDHTYLQEFWFRQSWEKLEITAGIQDLNVDVANTTYSTLYLNSSFGILPTVSGNIPAPLFPLTSLGICSNFKISKKSSLHIAAFDGMPTDFEDNPHNLKWHLSRNDGFLFFSEFQHETRFGKSSGTIKAGLYMHQHLSRNSEYSESDSSYRNNNGIYILGEQRFWQKENKSLGVFVQLGYSPKKVNASRYYIGAGLNYTGMLNRQGDDVLGIAFAHDGLQVFPGKETAVELTYQFPVCSFLFLQPNIQYIINPSGTGQKLDNCLVAILRFGINIPVRK